MTPADEKSLALRKWIFAGLMVAAGVLLSPMFSFPLGVTKAFPLQHMINIFLAVLCGTRYGTAAAFGTSLIRNLLGTGSLLAFPGSMVGAFLSGYLYSHTHKLWAAVIGEFVGTSIIGGLLLPDRRSLHGLGQRRLLLRLPLRSLLRRRLRHRLRRPEGHESDSNRILENVRKQKAQSPHRRLGFLCGLTLGFESRD